LVVVRVWGAGKGGKLSSEDQLRALHKQDSVKLNF
jgi:hypothetical protein